MRAERLVTLLFLLQQRRRATAAELAEALAVSERTVYRDIAALESAGVPLWTEQGRAGGVRLVEGWRTRLDGLTGKEAAAIFAIGVPEVLAELGLGSALAGARAKLTATLPTGLREYAARISDRFHLDAPGWFHRPEEVAHLATVAAAVADARRLEVRYGRADRTVERLLEPLGLVVKAGVWYLVAQPAPGSAPSSDTAPDSSSAPSSTSGSDTTSGTGTGSSSAPSASSAPGTGSASGSGSGTASGTGSSSAPDTAPGSGSGFGPAPASGSASAPSAGTAPDSGTGSSTGTTSGTGTGSSSAPSASSAPGTGSASGSGSGTASGTGSSSAPDTASSIGCGFGFAPGTGTAPGSCSASGTGTTSSSGTAPSSASSTGSSSAPDTASWSGSGSGTAPSTGSGDGPRTYRVARIVSAEVADSFQRPEFDLASWWSRTSARFERSLLRERVRVRLSPWARRLLPDVTDRQAAAEALAAAGPPDAEDWREVSLEVENERVALTQLTALGAGVEVLAPESLRAALADVGTQITARNSARR